MVKKILLSKKTKGILITLGIFIAALGLSISNFTDGGLNLNRFGSYNDGLFSLFGINLDETFITMSVDTSEATHLAVTDDHFKREVITGFDRTGYRSGDIAVLTMVAKYDCLLPEKPTSGDISFLSFPGNNGTYVPGTYTVSNDRTIATAEIIVAGNSVKIGAAGDAVANKHTLNFVETTTPGNEFCETEFVAGSKTVTQAEYNDVIKVTATIKYDRDAYFTNDEEYFSIDDFTLVNCTYKEGTWNVNQNDADEEQNQLEGTMYVSFEVEVTGDDKQDIDPGESCTITLNTSNYPKLYEHTIKVVCENATVAEHKSTHETSDWGSTLTSDHHTIAENEDGGALFDIQVSDETYKLPATATVTSEKDATGHIYPDASISSDGLLSVPVKVHDDLKVTVSADLNTKLISLEDEEDGSGNVVSDYETRLYSEATGTASDVTDGGQFIIGKRKTVFYVNGTTVIPGSGAAYDRNFDDVTTLTKIVMDTESGPYEFQEGEYTFEWDSTDKTYVLTINPDGNEANWVDLVGNIKVTVKTTGWWTNNDLILTYDETNLGDKKPVPVFGKNQDVVLIGINHDENNDDDIMRTTWQFANFLSDENGLSLAALWNNSRPEDLFTASHDFINSSLRKSLTGRGDYTGSGNAGYGWYEAGQGDRGLYENESLIDSLPDSLVGTTGSAATVVKQVYTTTNDWSSKTLSTFEDKLFLLSATEINGVGNEGSQYELFENTPLGPVTQVTSTGDSVLNDPTDVTDALYSGDDSPSSYAGYNSATNSYGGLGWTRSPNTAKNSSIGAYYINEDGSIIPANVSSLALAVNPCFSLGVPPKPWYKFTNWWEHIDEATENDVGREASLTINDIEQKVRLIGVDHDILSKDSTKAAHCTFEFSNVLSDSSGNTIGKQYDNKWSSWDDGVDTSNLRDYLRGDFINLLPEGLQDAIQTVKKVTNKGGATGSAPYTNFAVNDETVFLLSTAEIGCPNIASNFASEGFCYKYYEGIDSTSSTAKRKKTNINSTSAYYWLRSPVYSDTKTVYECSQLGSVSSALVTVSTDGFAPVFCVGEAPADWMHRDDWWNYTSEATEDDIGKVVKVTPTQYPSPYNVRLIGIDHDELADESNGYAHCTFEFTSVYSSTYSSGAGLARVFDNEKTPWSTGSSLKGFLNATVKSRLPTGLQDAIKTVKKITTHTDRAPKTTNDGIFILSGIEMGCSPSSTVMHAEEGTCYEYYKGISSDGNNAKRIKYDFTAAARDYWVRSPYTPIGDIGQNTCFCTTTGGFTNALSSTQLYFAPAFCI